MAAAVIIAMILVLSTASLHCVVLAWLSGGLLRRAITNHVRILVIVFATFLTHVAEVLLYAIAFTLSVEVLAIATFGGLVVTEPLDYLYFSIVTFTSLGLGDVFPESHPRFLAGVEALNGLLLIAWSGSLIYLTMGRLWHWERCAEPDCRTGSDD